MTQKPVQHFDFYKQIVEGLTNAVLLLNDHLRLDYINAAGETLYEISANRIKGVALKELFLGSDNLIQKIKKAFESGHPFTERELQLALPHQRLVTVDCAVTPLSDIKDVTNRRAMLIEINQLGRSIRISREEKQFAQSNAMRALIRGLAHEIKNPLGGLRGAAQLLERELNDPELKEFTNIIIGEADRLRNLVNRLLGPNTPLKRALINIHEITEHVRQLLQANKPEEVHITHDYDPSIPEIYADRDQLIQALLNITMNALHAVEQKGAITIRTRAVRKITIGHKRYKLSCQIDIIDNGPGIPEEMMETIFFPMVTNRAEGTGLGLSISQSLIQRHNGLIQLYSQPGHTIFSILLPIENT
ncbi:MAG: nitrogen regulation protein NR(II) [Gammaproteobacteria bacterium]|nr:nitrogen regulation protein NR(II) [Gammaproteobacteria bacterium]